MHFAKHTEYASEQICQLMYFEPHPFFLDAAQSFTVAKAKLSPSIRSMPSIRTLHAKHPHFACQASALWMPACVLWMPVTGSG
jgi:hypothetical protein